MVNINQAGTYEYTITYKKRKYIGNFTVKQKELPNVSLSVKTVSIYVGESLSTNPKSYINQTITDEVYNNLTLDLSQVKNTEAGQYTYYVIYKNTKYQGHIIVKAKPGPKIITPSQQDKTDPVDDNKDEDNPTVVTPVD